jgi:hypothetical protein
LLAPSYTVACRARRSADQSPRRTLKRSGANGDVGDAHQGHLAVAGAAEVGVEQGELAVELALRARARASQTICTLRGSGRGALRSATGTVRAKKVSPLRSSVVTSTALRVRGRAWMRRLSRGSAASASELRALKPPRGSRSKTQAERVAALDLGLPSGPA